MLQAATAASDGVRFVPGASLLQLLDTTLLEKLHDPLIKMGLACRIGTVTLGYVDHHALASSGEQDPIGIG